MNDTEIAEVLRGMRRVAVVGASSDPGRDANKMMRLLLDHGVEVVPVNPTEAEVLGVPAVPSLEHAGNPLDVVFVYRRSEHAAGVVEAAIAAGAQAIWLPVGVTTEAGGARAAAQGVRYVEDRCPVATYRLMDRMGMLAS